LSAISALRGRQQSARRSLAAKVLVATCDVEAVQKILGHSCLDHNIKRKRPWHNSSTGYVGLQAEGGGEYNGAKPGTLLTLTSNFLPMSLF
jgi:hypothetical protein